MSQPAFESEHALAAAPMICLVSLRPFRAYMVVPRCPAGSAHAQRFAKLASSTMQRALSRAEELLNSPMGDAHTLQSQHIAEVGMLVSEPILADLKVQAARRTLDGLFQQAPNVTYHLPDTSTNVSTDEGKLRTGPHVLCATPRRGVTLGSAADRLFDERLSIRSTSSMSTEASLQNLKTNVFASHVSTIGPDRMRHIMDGGRTEVKATEDIFKETRQQLKQQQELKRQARRDGKLVQGAGQLQSRFLR